MTARIQLLLLTALSLSVRSVWAQDGHRPGAESRAAAVSAPSVDQAQTYFAQSKPLCRQLNELLTLQSMKFRPERADAEVRKLQRQALMLAVEVARPENKIDPANNSAGRDLEGSWALAMRLIGQVKAELPLEDYHLYDWRQLNADEKLFLFKQSLHDLSVEQLRRLNGALMRLALTGRKVQLHSTKAELDALDTRLQERGGDLLVSAAGRFLRSVIFDDDATSPTIRTPDELVRLRMNFSMSVARCGFPPELYLPLRSALKAGDWEGVGLSFSEAHSSNKASLYIARVLEKIGNPVLNAYKKNLRQQENPPLVIYPFFSDRNELETFFTVTL